MKSSLILRKDRETPNSQGDSPNHHRPLHQLRSQARVGPTLKFSYRSVKTDVGIFGTFSEKGHEDCQTVFSSFGSKDETSSHVSIVTTKFAYHLFLVLTWACNFRPVIRGRPSAKRAIHICGQPRWVFVLVFSAMSFFLWFASCGILMVLWAFAIGLLATLIHASFRTPNLKARLNTFREEFRAVWHNYSEL
ncbi:prenylated rab acceptor family protein [Striga asiatica]|uniref:PRA1 family protein n=1 Tax=Striga asiatica TaxID=4170 RepID=A0A5A7PJB0_STRAF|nr:prenylated rab acceptor family protein [Striga asiatica]